ncbi:MAG: CDC48 family AAA ATPase [Candidatus Aenigmarchaeota archaeon]|nr:CDC48 family AAA ATPase [Candidatus Aenigmarchaeota archaeon]
MAKEKDDKGITLKVGELTQREEFGRGIVRMDSSSMQKIGVKEGSVVEIQGSRKSGAIAVRAYPSDAGLKIIRMDGLMRRNVGSGVGDNVKVKRADVKEAKKVTLAPAQKGVVVQISPSLIKQNIYYRPLSKGDIIIPSPVVKKKRRNDLGDDMFRDFFGFGLEDFFYMPTGETRFIVTSTDPGEIVRITDMTKLEILPRLPKDFDLEKRAVPAVTYEDVGGIHQAIQKIREMIELPLRHPELFDRLGIEAPKGVLLYGPPGTGKTLLARAVANESGANFYSVSGPEIFSKWYGQTEKNLRKIFDDAEKNSPAIIFIDEIDAMAPKREEVTGEVERRTVSQLLTLMDGLKQRGKVIVIAATNRKNALDPALRRPGRFDREIEIGVPDKKGRKEVLQIHSRHMPLEKDVNMDKLADITYGYVGADLESLAKEAAMHALRRLLPEIKWKEEGELPEDVLEKLSVTQEDFEYALKIVEPSAMREVMIEVPTVKWKDVGGLADVKQELKEAVEWPLKNPESFERMGITPPKGILLYGPPGCGKTMLAKAVANESNSNFISVKGPELFSKWVGESEKRVRELFRRAKQVSPSIIFFDEIDALVPKRGSSRGENVSEKVVSQMLTELSGLEDLHDVVVVAATNRPDILDTALLRPGRFDRKILVPQPDEEARLKILEIKTKKVPIQKDVKLKNIAKETEGYSGADLEVLVREAAMHALRKDNKSDKVTKKDFEHAIENIKPSLNKDIIKFYQQFDERSSKKFTELDDMEELKYVG